MGIFRFSPLAFFSPRLFSGGDFSKTVTFREVVDRIERGEDFYDICNCTESQERERVFAELEHRTGKPYDYWYDLWLCRKETR